MYTLLWSFDIVFLLIQILGIHSVGEPRQVLHRLIRDIEKQCHRVHIIWTRGLSQNKRNAAATTIPILNIPFFVLTGQTAAGASAGWGTFLTSVGVDGLFPIFFSVMMTLAIYNPINKSVEKAS
jgi:hypothetical protein